MNHPEPAPIPTLSIIIPVLNDASALSILLAELQPFRERGAEVIVVDGTNADESVAICDGRVDRIVVVAPGRAKQMNAGAAIARGSAFWFLHADSVPPVMADALLVDYVVSGYGWGRFDITLSGSHWLFRWIERLITWRSRLSGIATGDQGVFVTRASFAAVGGFPDVPLMEDVILSRRLCRLQRPACVGLRLITSSRRWEQNGIVRTVLLMWWLRLRFALGADPADLHRRYYRPQ